MADIRKRVQTILDALLLPYGVTSHYMRREDSEGTSQNEYVAYTVTPSHGGLYGDGRRLATRSAVVLTYYYKYDKKVAQTRAAAERAQEIENAFRALSGWTVTSGQSDIYDSDLGMRGITLTVSYYGVTP